MNTKCMALYSGGLDSILAVKLLQEQGIEVIPVHFASPFFGSDLLFDAQPFVSIQREKFGIEARIVDVSDAMTDLLLDPPHGFGKNLNPCIDCKIMMLRKCRELMETLGASFVITGEVAGQRPMSQRRDALNIVERESGLKGRLLRPLSARLLAETEPELAGVVDRSSLLDIAGRGRKHQVDLALRMGIAATDIPASAGGCLLTNEQIAGRVRGTIGRLSPHKPAKYDLLLDIAGRKFLLDRQTVVVISRRQQENDVLARMRDGLNIFVKIDDVPGPLAVLRGTLSPENLKTAAGICLRYGKGRGRGDCVALYGTNPDRLDNRLSAPLLSDEICRSMQIDLPGQN